LDNTIHCRGEHEYKTSVKDLHTQVNLKKRR